MCCLPPGLADVLDVLGVQAGPAPHGPRQRPGHGPRDTQLRVEVVGRGVGLGRLGLRQAQGLVDELPALHVAPVDEGHRDPVLARAAGPADAVQVGLLVVGALVVHHVGDVLDVEAARSHVGGHQHVDLSAAEGPQGAFPLALAQVTVHGGDREAPGGQCGRDLVGRPLGLAEHQGQAAPVGLQHAGQHLDLVQVVGPEDVLLGGRDRGGRVDGLGAHMGRPAQMPSGQRNDLTRHRGREHHGLPLSWGELQDAFHVRQEAEVEHLVRLVQHEGPHFAQAQVPLAHEIQQPAGSADDDVDTRAERLDLRLVGAATVEGQHPGTQPRACHPQVVGDLDGQFPGGDDNERTRGLRVGLRLVLEPLQQRDTEAKRLAGAGARLADDVVAAQCDRQGQGLNGKGGVYSCRLEGDADRVRDAKFAERHRMRGIRRHGACLYCRGVLQQDLAAGTVSGGGRFFRRPLPGQCFAGQGFQPPSIPPGPAAFEQAGRRSVVCHHGVDRAWCLLRIPGAYPAACAIFSALRSPHPYYVQRK